MMRIKQIYWVLLLALFGLASCAEDDGVETVKRVDLFDFEFPQGDNPWDKEIEQIAKDWGMYIIYKEVDSTRLNRMWTVPVYNAPIYVCTTPSDEDIQVYLNLVKEWLLGSLDQKSDEDRKSLPFYLYLVNDLNDGNPRSETYQKRHIQFKKDGFDYWSLSFTSEELAAGLTPQQIHEVACAFSYPGLKTRFMAGEYEIAPGFIGMTDYETRIGIRYLSFEEWKVQNPWAPDQYYESWVNTYERDPLNIYTRRGIAAQVGEDFEVVRDYYGAPTWMPWILATYNGEEFDKSPGPVAETVEDRALLDFLNMIRVAMRYTEAQVRELYPIDVEDPLDRAGYQIINDKYDLVVEYMKTTYEVDLQKYAEILEQ
ncbi:hypothetical protein [Butyricimonas synergistica]|uniref:hypothetical protein n=1 Tax=Butyricimonas synergistica TaxID=544644 RepID=UPI0003A12EE9|nr:hypothetical protein [Butyricimonas synergistica]